MSAAKIRFKKPDGEAFVADVRRRVAAYFEETGKSDKANAAMVLKTIVLLSLTIGSYVLIMSGLFTPMQMLGLCILLGVGMAGIGFSVAHDALHGAYSNSPFVNRMLGYCFDLVGANGYMWKITHNVIHHTYTNIDGVDEDLTVSPLLRLSPGADRKWYHRYQHLYGFLAYSFATINWVFAKDYQQFMKRDLGPYKDKTHPPKEIAVLIVTKLFCYFYTIVLPLLVLDITWWQFLIGFTAMHLTAGTILGVIFQLAHVVEGPEFPVPDESGRMGAAWIIHEMHTTANFARRNHPLSWYIGGLNYQIEHHLFPQVCSIHYPTISRIVRESAEEHGVPYHYHPTLMAAIKSHYRMLKELGTPALALEPAA
ncbi:MAG: acyl-CoA desaturase [Bacteroidetes bacterium]|nr:acyl-CoA desaturase [Bacteroidota bacterium]